MRKVSMFAAGLVAMFCMVSCGNTAAEKTADASVFEGKTVTLMNFVEGEALPSGLQEPVVMMFNKEEGAVNGFTGCNRFFGKYIIEGDVVKFENVGVTKMMCDPVANEVEMKVMDILNTVNRFETTENSVIFYNGDKRLGEFCAKSAGCPERKPCCSNAEKAACTTATVGHECCEGREGVPCCKDSVAAPCEGMKIEELVVAE